MAIIRLLTLCFLLAGCVSDPYACSNWEITEAQQFIDSVEYVSQESLIQKGVPKSGDVQPSNDDRFDVRVLASLDSIQKQRVIHHEARHVCRINKGASWDAEADHINWFSTKI